MSSTVKFIVELYSLIQKPDKVQFSSGKKINISKALGVTYEFKLFHTEINTNFKI